MKPTQTKAQEFDLDPQGRLPARDLSSRRQGEEISGAKGIEGSASLPRALIMALGAGAVFGVGLVCGGIGRAEAAPVVVDVDPVARAEARTKAYHELMKATPLTWHQELTAPEPALPALPAPSALPTAAKAPVPPRPLAEAATAAPIVDKALAAYAPDLAVQKPALVRDGNDDAVDNDDDAGPVVRPDPKLLAAAMARVLGEQKVAPPVSDKRYAVQLASTGTEASARTLAEGWTQRGQKAVVVAADVAGKGTMYRVRIGGIASRAAADALKLKLGQGLVVSD